MGSSTTISVLAAILSFAGTRVGKAQTLTFTSRNGAAVVGAGQVVGGPLVEHRYATTDETHDAIAVSDPGGDIPVSAAQAQLDAVPLLTGIRLATTGSAMRGPLPPSGNGAANAFAAITDEWTFTLSTTTSFTLDVTLSAASTNTAISVQAFNLGVLDFGLITLSGGQHPSALTGSLMVPGTQALSFSGTLAPGNYFVTLIGRADGNGAPLHTSYAHTLSLSICAADFNSDGQVNSQDFFDFLGAFFAAAPSADVNHDGQVNSQDFFDFLTRFFAGC